MFSSATQPPPRHNFVVSAITFEGFKLHSSNLTHALLIQISRTSLIIDIVVPSKMAAGGHFVKKKKLRIDLKWQEMWSKVIFGHSKWPPAAILSRIKFFFIKIRMDLKWPKMQSKVNFGYLIWPIDQKWPENAIESELWTSKMAAEKNNKFCIDLKC